MTPNTERRQCCCRDGAGVFFLMSLAPTGGSYAGPAAGTGAGWINAEFEHLERAIRGSRLVDGRALSSDLFTGTSADMAVALSSLSMGQVAGAGSAVRRPHLGRRVYLTGQPPQAVAQEQLSDVSRKWSHVDKTSIAELEMLLSRHGSSAEADYARARLAPLKKQQADLAQQAADAAKMKADDEASTKAEAARQCLAMLQQREAEAAKKRAEATDAATPWARLSRLRGLPGDGGGAGRTLHHWLADERTGTLRRGGSACGDDRQAVCSRSLCCDAQRVCGVCCSHGPQDRWRLQHVERHGVGATV